MIGEIKGMSGKMQQKRRRIVKLLRISRFGTRVDFRHGGGYKEMTTEALNYPVFQSEATMSNDAKAEAKKQQGS